MINKTAVQETLRACGLRVSSQFLEELDKYVSFVISQVAIRAKANARATVKACDLPVLMSDLPAGVPTGVVVTYPRGEVHQTSSSRPEVAYEVGRRFGDLIQRKKGG